MLAYRALSSPNLTALVALNEQISTKFKINKEQTNRSSRANNKYIYCGVRPDLLIRRLYLINGFAKSAGSLREVFAKSSRELERYEYVLELFG